VHGDYTCMSDVFQARVMLESMQLISEDAKAFANGLISKQLTAAIALQQPLMNGRLQ
jgi:hypothetical protein